MHTIKGKLYKTITLTCTTAHFLCSRKRDKITIIIHAYRSFHKKLGEPVNMCVRWHAGSQWHHLICRTTWSTRHAPEPSGAVAVTTTTGDGWNCLWILCGPTLSLHGFDDESYGYHSWNMHLTLNYWAWNQIEVYEYIMLFFFILRRKSPKKPRRFCVNDRTFARKMN